MSYKVVTRMVICNEKSDKKMDLFEKGRIVQALLSETMPFGYLMTSISNNDTSYSMSEADVVSFIKTTANDVMNVLTTSLDEDYTFESFDVTTMKVDKTRYAVAVSSVLKKIEKEVKDEVTEEAKEVATV